MAKGPSQATSRNPHSSAVVGALSVYVEPLVADARVAVVGDGELGLHERLLELGARTVHLFDPDPERVARTADEVPRGVSVRMLRDDFDVRDAAFDLVIIPDIGILPDPASAIVRLRRVIDPRGAVVALGRARTGSTTHSGPRAHADDVFPELVPAVVEYAELYDLFALQFESVTMTGVLPFAGVVFAELGATEDVAVSVDTRLVDPDPPQVFVVVAGREAALLDPYAIVQIAPDAAGDEAGVRDTTVASVPAPPPVSVRDVEVSPEAAAAFAAMQLKAELLAAQLDEHRARLGSVDGRIADYVARLEEISAERDLAITRATELEGILAAAQQALEMLEQRLVAAEQGMLERDDQIASLNAELDTRDDDEDESLSAGAETRESVDPALLAEIAARAQHAEAALAQTSSELVQLEEDHAADTASLEEQLRDRARVIGAMEKELARREHLVRELVASLEEARENPSAPTPFQASPVMPGLAPEDVARLRRKLDDLALEVARRDGELVARGWRITELENEREALVAKTAAALDARGRAERAAAIAAAAAASPAPAAPPSSDTERELARVRDEVDALRQALTQEHAARLAAESGEELSRAREELARQAVLLEQIKGRGTHPEG